MIIKEETKLRKMFSQIKRDRQLLILVLPCVIFYIVFRYGPMYGLAMAFTRYSVSKGIMGSTWVGLKYFEQFFQSSDFLMLLKNTFLLGIYSLICTFPFPVAFAILLNELRSRKFKKIVQTVSYMPSFLSIVIVCSMTIDFLSPSNGIINHILNLLGFDSIYFMIKPEWFRTVYIVTDIWQNTGYGAIIYLAALSGIDPHLYEAANVDGCGRFRSIWYITLPQIFPTIATMFIIKSGSLFRIGFEKVLLLYNPATYDVADVFSTFVYRKGILEANFSYAAAAGLFESLIAFALLIITNALSRKLSERSIW